MNLYPKNLQKFGSATAIVAAFFLSIACTNQGREISGDTDSLTYENMSEVRGAYTRVSDEVREEKVALRESVHQQLDKVDERIEEMEDKMRDLSESAKVQYGKTIKQMDDEREKLVDSYKRIDDASDDNWRAIKSYVQDVIKEVDEEINELAKSQD